MAIGGEYAKIATRGAEFDVPRDPLHEGLLTTLKNAGRVTEFPKRRNQEFYTVKVA